MLDAGESTGGKHTDLPAGSEPMLPLNPCLCLDDVVHQRTRLALLCELDAAGELDFNSLKALLGLSDGNLARHLTVLRAASLVDLEKRIEGGRRRTFASLTARGTDALQEEFKLLERLIVVVRHRSTGTEHLAS
jgi:DNA-binding transcriptional ArsR family regulator